MIEERYGNLFEMYERITDEDPYKVPMRIYPAVHYTMGGLWVDYDLQSTIPGCFVAGEANFSDHGANRLGASALMQGLADGYFVLPYTVPNYLAGMLGQPPVPDRRPRVRRRPSRTVRERTSQFLAIGGTRSVDHFHRELGKIMWDNCGMARSRSRASRRRSSEIPPLREEFEKDLRVLGTADTLNQSLEKAGRVADFFELGRADVPRRAAPRGVVRRPLPRRAPDRGRRGAARRRQLRVRRGVGVRGAGDEPRAAQGAARLRVRPPRAEELQVRRP